jgi:hypothetical protein
VTTYWINWLCLSLLCFIYVIWTFWYTGNKAFMKVFQWFYWNLNHQFWEKWLFQKRAVCTKLDIYVLFYYRVSTSICYIYIKCDNRSTVDYDVLNNIGLLKCTQHVSEITFTWYAPNRKIGKPSNVKRVWEQ